MKELFLVFHVSIPGLLMAVDNVATLPAWFSLSGKTCDLSTDLFWAESSEARLCKNSLTES
jgi:hypothetical protein